MATQLNIPNFLTPSTDISTGGRAQPADLQQAQAQGVQTVINLCPISEDPGFDEAALVASLGMEYVNIAIASAADLTPAKARELSAALAARRGPALVHCASGNRVGALFALKAHHVDGVAAEQAIEIGRAHGLKAMEPAVRQLLGI
ncbi:MAG TPA: sulfur transferase domain-containing protein [Fontimonas sp.]